MAKAQSASDDVQAIPDQLDYLWLRNQAIEPCETKVATLAAERHEQLADLFIAVRDKPRPNDFEAGLKGRKRRRLAAAADGDKQVKEEPLEGADDFLRRFSDSKSLRELDLSLPPFSPSPPPPQADAAAFPTSATAPLSVPSLKVGEMAVDSDEDADADGEEEDEEMAVAEALAPPRVALTSTAGNVDPGAGPAGTPAEVAAAVPSPAHVASPSAPQPPAQAATTSLADSTALTAAASATVLPSLSESQTQPSQPPAVAPSLLTAAPSPVPSSPQPPVASTSAYVAPQPYTSLFGIHEISSDYVDSLPPIPHDILRNRLNTSLALRASTKKSNKSAFATSSSTSLVQPDLYKLHVRAQHIGAKTFVGPGKRVHNALSTHEWDVGIDEMKAIRAFERIEQLKAEKRWSFRQPKKQRVGVVPKAHRDYLLDEMRWMHTDFRQEMRWKIVTAYKLARACRAWKRASTDDRPNLCVRVRPPRFLNPDAKGKEKAPAEEVGFDLDMTADDAESAPKTEKGKERAQLEEDVDAEGEEDADGEVDDARPAPPAAASASGTPLPPSAPNGAPGLGKTGGSSSNESTLPPTPGNLSRAQQAQLEAAKAHAQAQHIQALINFRNPIFDFDADETVIDPLLLAALRDARDNTPGEAQSLVELDLAALFPDLPLYSDFILAEDANMARRVEDSSAWMGRLANVTRLLETKPLLVSTMQPGRTKTRMGWTEETAAVLEDIEPPVDPREQPPTTSSVLFLGRKPKDVITGEVLVRPPPVPQPDIRASSILWLPEEDAKLLALQRQYGFNWPLIAEVFNSVTQRPASDHRLPWDCYDRWDRLVGPGSKKVLPDGTEISVPAPEYIPPVDKMGRQAPMVGNGSKKNARHVTILDAMKKVQKKREAYAAKQPPPGFPRRINMSMHESHNLPPRPVWSPMEWSVYKMEQEAQKLRLRQAQQQAQAAAHAQQQAAAAQAVAAQQNGIRYQPQTPMSGNFSLQPGQQPPVGPPGQQLPRPASSLPPQMAAAAAQATARASPTSNVNGTPASNVSPSPAPAQIPLQLPNGTPQLTPEQLQMLQQRQQALLQAQAHHAQRQAQAQAQAAAAAQVAASGHE
ncbi:hypothetical protein JCM21900_002091 [Sporobolomyces salmonicolor]